MNKPRKRNTIRLSLLGVNVTSIHPDAVVASYTTLTALRRAKGSQQTINRTTRLADTRCTTSVTGTMYYGKRCTMLRHFNGVKP